MEEEAIQLSSDEREDIRFALAQVADQNDVKAALNADIAIAQALREQADRFRRLAKKITG